MQAARADQLCFPHLPDVLAMCSVLSRGQQQLPFTARTKVEQSLVDAASALPYLPTFLCCDTVLPSPHCKRCGQL